jgi:bacteriorhodopsin
VIDRDELGLPASGEAEAQREATVMPWIWGGFGLLVIAAFVAWVLVAAPTHVTPNPPAAAPTLKPLDHGY